LQPLDHGDYSYEAKSKQTYPQKLATQTEDLNRRHARLITNIPTEQSENDKNEIITNENPKLFSLKTFDDSIKHVQTLSEMRKNLQTKYDEHSEEQDNIHHSVNIPIERVNPSQTIPTDSDMNQSDKDKMRDRRYRSRTLELNKKGAVDNQIYGCPSSQTIHEVRHQSELHKHRTNPALFRRSCEDLQDKQFQLRRHLDYSMTNSNETWLEIGQEHWTNLLENGWRPTLNTPGVNLVSFTDSGMEINFN
jgi:hypothetical protein